MRYLPPSDPVADFILDVLANPAKALVVFCLAISCTLILYFVIDAVLPSDD